MQQKRRQIHLEGLKLVVWKLDHSAFAEMIEKFAEMIEKLLTCTLGAWPPAAVSWELCAQRGIVWLYFQYELTPCKLDPQEETKSTFSADLHCNHLYLFLLTPSNVWPS